MNGTQEAPEENGPVAAQVLQGVRHDPYFTAPAAGGLDYPAERRNEALLAHLSHAVAHQPANLHLHLRRIRLAAALALPEPLAGAIADLFIVLGDKGQDLRKHILNTWKGPLSRQQLAMFRQALYAGIDAYTPLPAIRSRLSKGNGGRRHRIVVPLGAAANAADTEGMTGVFLETVRDLIDSGRLVEASEALEKALPEADETLWGEGAIELARLYRYLEDGESRARSWWAVLWRSNRSRAQAWAELVTQSGEP